MNSLNIDIQTDGSMRKRKGWKTFEGMVYQLRLINERYNKQGWSGDFTIRLPLPTKKGKHEISKLKEEGGK